MVCPVAKLSSRRWHPPLTWIVCDDPDAGTTYGYRKHTIARAQYDQYGRIGDRHPICDACRFAQSAAANQYKKRRVLAGGKFIPTDPNDTKSQIIVGGHQTMPALGVMRRMQCLTALGYSYGELATMTYKEKRDIGHLLVGERKRVRREMWELVAKVFDSLALKPSTGPRAPMLRAMAKAKGFLPPLAWDDEELDRPDGLPSGLNYRELRDWVNEFATPEQRVRYNEMVRPKKASA